MISKVLLVTGVSATLLHADMARSSANYTLAHETTHGSLGVRSTSVNYTLDSSSNPAAAVAASSNYTQRDGFAGQLLDPVSLEITGPNIIAEGSSGDFNANLIYDDGTTTPDVASSWSILSGPVLSITSSGLAPTDIVYQTTGAIIAAQYLGLNASTHVSVIDIDPDNFGAYSGDGLADSWQIFYFGVDNADAAPDLDPDGDGQDNAFEFLSGYLPVDASSRLFVTVVASDTIELSQVIPSTNYQLERSTNLVDWTTVGPVLAPSSFTFDQPFTDNNPPGGPRVFYRVDLE